MLGNATPTASQIASTVDFLTVLEMASDPKKVKAALAEIKSAQDALIKQGEDTAAQLAAIDAAAKKLAGQEGKSFAAAQKADDSIAKSTKAIADTEQAKAELDVLRQEIAAKQGVLDLREQEFSAYCKRKEADFKREEGLIAESKAAADRAAEKLAGDAQAANDLRVTYEGKLAQLQALAG